VTEERLKLAVFVDFDNIQIGVKETLGKEFDVSLVLEALKERGEVVSKIAYGDWPRAGEHGRQMSQHAVQMVQRNVTPRGDKNGADINLALDALEMAFTRDHINAFAIVGGDSDFITLVEKLKQYDKRVFVVGGKQFTSIILQRNCHEFIAYENLLKGDGVRTTRASRAGVRAGGEARQLSHALPNIHRALKILAEREVAPQLGLLKSTLLQLDPTFSERDFGTGSFLEFMQKMQRAGLVHLRRTERGFLVEPVEAESAKEPPVETQEAVAESAPAEEPATTEAAPSVAVTPESLVVLRQALDGFREKAPNRPIYLRQIRQALRSLNGQFDDTRAGYRRLMDLLHAAQREGWLRLHRDRKGVLRVFPVTGAVAAPSVEAAPVESLPGAPEVVEFGPAEADVTWEEPPKVEDLGAVEAPPSEPLVVAEAAEGEAAVGRKGRRTRGSRGGARSGQRKSPTRRKAKPEGEE